MSRMRQCPICGNVCRVAADGRSGYCERLNKPWTKETIPLSEVQPGPIVHPTLPAFLLGIIRWTYLIVGRYIQPTLEQWELGFMRDLHVEREVCYWHRLAYAFITYHRRRGLPPQSDEIERHLVRSFVVLGEADNGLSIDEETFLRDCFDTPDGWDEEVARLERLRAEPDPAWSPPEIFEGWSV